MKRKVIAGGTAVALTGVEKSIKVFGSACRFATVPKPNSGLAKGAKKVYLATEFGYSDHQTGCAIARPKEVPLYGVKPNRIPTAC